MRKIDMYNDVTMVLTSCNRLDLLEKTILSIPKLTLNKIPKKILIDDSADQNCFEKLKKENKNGYLIEWTLLLNEEKLGQPGSIDRAYSEVKTKYVFHCEDDWYFEDGNFIDRSLPILEKYDNILQVTFRSDSPHPVCDDVYEEGTDFEFEVLVPGYNGWPGFTYNPNLFRFSAYEEIKPIVGKTEKDVGLIYKDKELFTVALKHRTVSHIGDGRHVYDTINKI
jgi:glycosyltransferase involved in cell wall biosynthesis